MASSSSTIRTRALMMVSSGLGGPLPRLGERRQIGRLERLDGQVDGEGAPLAGPALHRHPAAVGLDDVADDREAQAAPLDVVDQPGAHAVEAVEDLALLVARAA